MYLKYLSTDWQGFTAACQRMSLAVSCDAVVSGLTCKQKTGTRSYPDQVESGFCFQPTAPGLRLVDYDSSDESDPDNMEVSVDSQKNWKKTVGPDVSVFKKSSFSDWDFKLDKCTPPDSIKQTNHLSSNPTEPLSDPNSSLQTRPRQSPLPVVQSEHLGQVFCEASDRAMFCLSELRKVVTKLQTKKLFPYNPSSLLKLLAQLEKCSQE